MNIRYTKWDGEEVIEIEAGGYMARISPNMGGNIIKLSYRGEDLLNTPEDMRAYRGAQNNYGAPHLFPPNRIKDGRFSFEGREYKFPVKPSGNSLHGFLHDKVWSAAEENREEESAAVTLFYESSPEEDYYEYFPHRFRCRRRYILSSEGLRDEYEVENLGEDGLPLSVGFHTAFPVRGEESRIRVSLENRIELGENKIPTGEIWGLNQQEKLIKEGGQTPLYDTLDNLYSRGSDSRGAEVAGVHSLGRIIYETDERYRYWVLCNYNKRGDIICIEPQTGMIDAHNQQNGGLIPLKSRETWRAVNKIYLKKSS